MVEKTSYWSPPPSEEALIQLVEQWLEENIEDAPNEARNRLATDQIIDMRYDARVETQLAFVEKAIELASTEWQLIIIAAGPLENLLAEHGETIIDTVIAKSRQNPKFRKTMTGVWQQGMPDQVWTKVQSEKDACPEAQRLK